MGSPPIARRRDTFRRRPGVVSGSGTLLQSELEPATGESVAKSENVNHYTRASDYYLCNNYVSGLEELTVYDHLLSFVGGRADTWKL